jgi:hypothetical protein
MTVFPMFPMTVVPHVRHVFEKRVEFEGAPDHGFHSTFTRMLPSGMVT